MDSYRFPTARQAISYYNLCNPARARYKNLLEQERGQQVVAEQFSGDHPHDIWSSVCLAIKRVLKDLPDSYRTVFQYYHLGVRGRYLGAEQISNLTGYPVKIVRKMLSEAMEEIEQELIRRELIEPKRETVH